MKKILFTITVLAGAALSSFAQTTSTATTAKEGAKFSIGAEGGIPVGDASNIYSSVIGGSVKCEIPISPTAYITLSGGYNAFLIKSSLQGPLGQASSSLVPVKAGIKVYTDGSFFLEGQAGSVFSTESGGGNSFAWSAGFGYTFSGGFEAGARYEAWTNGGTIGQAGLRLAYRF